jgi:hypothetical protein
LPSIVTTAARNSSPDASVFHIIQPVVVNHRAASPGLMSQHSPMFL